MKYIQHEMTGIYKITSPTNNVYIGQSRNLHKRLTAYKRMDCKEQHGIYRSLIKYGVDKHKFEVIHELQEGCSQDVLNYHECFFMRVYSVSGYTLLNIRGGGHNGSFSEETKTKISISKKGCTSWNKGIKWLNPKRSEYLQNKINEGSFTSGFKGKCHSEATREMFSAIRKASPVNNNKAIIKLNKNGNILTEYESITLASNDTGILVSSLSNALSGKSMSSGGFIWKFKNTHNG